MADNLRCKAGAPLSLSLLEVKKVEKVDDGTAIPCPRFHLTLSMISMPHPMPDAILYNHSHRSGCEPPVSQ